MDSNAKFMLIAVIFAFTLVINIPFGYFRKKSKKYSFKWFLYIHLPIPLIIAARILSHIEFKFVPIFVIAAVIGQLLGGRLEGRF